MHNRSSQESKDPKAIQDANESRQEKKHSVSKASHESKQEKMEKASSASASNEVSKKLPEVVKEKAEEKTEEKPDQTNVSENPDDPLRRHIEAFGGVRDNKTKITIGSMAKVNHEMNGHWGSAYVDAIKVSAGVGVTLYGCPFLGFSSSDGSNLRHAYSLKIFEDHGINQENLDALCKGASKPDKKGIPIITKSSLLAYLTEFRKQETVTNGAGKTASNGEWNDFFKRVGKNKKGEEPYVTVTCMRQFYIDSQKVVDEVKAERNARKGRL